MSDNTRNSLAGSIVGLIALIATAVFLLIGFTRHVWHPTWIVFFAIPIASVLTDVIIRKKPTGAITGVVSLLATAVFLVLGFYYGRWHPTWLVFFAIPIANILVKIFEKAGSDTCGQPKDDTQN